MTTNLVDELMALGGREFYAIVDRDIRGQATPEQAAALRTPEVIERWYQTLIQMKKSVTGTIAARSSDDKAKRIPLLAAGRYAEAADLRASYHKQKSGSMRFLTGVEEQITEASWRRRQLLGTQLQSVAIQERNALIVECHRLKSAIEKHKHNVVEDPEFDPKDVDEIDEELWGVLSNA